MFCKYLLVLFGFVLVSGVIGLYILVNLCLVCGWIAYVLAFWRLSSTMRTLWSFGVGVRCPFVYIFQKF